MHFKIMLEKLNSFLITLTDDSLEFMIYFYPQPFLFKPILNYTGWYYTNIL